MGQSRSIPRTWIHEVHSNSTCDWNLHGASLALCVLSLSIQTVVVYVDKAFYGAGLLRSGCRVFDLCGIRLVHKYVAVMSNSDILSVCLCLLWASVFLAAPILLVWDLLIVIVLVMRKAKKFKFHILGVGLSLLLVSVGYAWDRLTLNGIVNAWENAPAIIHFSLLLIICTIPIAYFLHSRRYLDRSKKGEQLEFVFNGALAWIAAIVLLYWSFDLLPKVFR